MKIDTAPAGRAAHSVKIVVWDLDHTLWDGVLLEDADVTPREQVIEVIKTLDGRGILHSIASRNDPAAAMEKLRQIGLADYFLYPQINWGPKSESLRAIARAINLGLNSFAFVDDQPFEREEVAFALPEVLTIDAQEVARIPAMPAMTPRFITEDSQQRRLMYLADLQRNEVEQSFSGTGESFLATLGMRFSIARAQVGDLQRAEELTVRTNQLNSTGYTYTYEELRERIDSPEHLLLVASLDDRFGTYGKIGLALVERSPERWWLKLLLMSCRVLSRGTGSILLSYLLQQARAAGARFLAEFVTTERNRMMYVTYKFSGFREVERNGQHILFEHDLDAIPPFPPYVEITTPAL